MTSTMRSAICVSFDLHNSIYIFWGARDLEFWKFCLADSLPLHTLRKGNDAIDVLSYADSTKKKEKRKGDRHTPPCQVENVSMLRETWAEAQGPSPCEAANDGIEVKRKVSLQEGNKLEVPRCLKIKASRNNRTILTLDKMTSWTEHERRRSRGMRKATGDSTCHSLTQEAAPSEEPNEIQLPIARRTMTVHDIMSMSRHFFHPTSATSRIDASCPIDTSCPSHLRDLLLNTLHISLPMQPTSFMYISLQKQTSFLQHGARLVSWIKLGVLVRADWKFS